MKETPEQTKILDKISSVINMEDEKILHTRDGYKEIFHKYPDKMPTLSSLTKAFGTYTEFKRFVGYDFEDQVVSKPSKNKISLKDFLKERRKDIQ